MSWHKKVDMNDNLEKTIADLRAQLTAARQRMDRYNEDRQTLIKRIERLRALVKMLGNMISAKVKQEKEKEAERKNV